MGNVVVPFCDGKTLDDVVHTSKSLIWKQGKIVYTEAAAGTQNLQWRGRRRGFFFAAWLGFPEKGHNPDLSTNKALVSAQVLKKKMFQTNRVS